MNGAMDMVSILRKYRHTLICMGILFSLSVFGCVMIVVRWIFTGDPEFLFLIWNLFLSWIPLGVSAIMSYRYSSRTGGRKLVALVPLGIVWLLFYPNAPYMITDFIHFRNNYTFLIWYDLVIYSIFIWTSFLLGFVSIYLVNRIVEKETNKITGWLFTLFILFLSSYGIYLGRFIRWNSWDLLLNPLALLQSILGNIHLQSLVFSLIYGMLLTLMYAFLYGLTYLKLEKID
jgi:uncharacterized membrane protein